MKPKKLINIVIFLILIVIVYLIFSKINTKSNFENNICTQDKDSIYFEVNRQFGQNSEVLNLNFKEKINCIDKCKLLTIYDNGKSDLSCKKLYEDVCSEACSLKENDISETYSKAIQICVNPDNDNDEQTNCEWLKEDEYKPPKKIKRTEVRILSDCRKFDKNEPTCLKNLLIFWEIPYSFYPIIKYILKLTRIEDIPGTLDSKESHVLYDFKPNNLQENSFILENKKNSFFYIDKNTTNKSYTLTIYSINKNGNSVESEPIFITNERDNCCNDKDYDNFDNKKSKTYVRIELEQKKINEYLTKLRN